jgi:homeobox protein cut-like
MDASQRQEQDVAARLAELDLVAADLARANERVANVERRNEILRSEIESVRSGSQQAERVKAMESQISDLEAEASRLLRALDQVKETKAESERAQQKKIDEMSRDVSTRSAEVDNLRAKVKQYSDYDELKRELEIMKVLNVSKLINSLSNFLEQILRTVMMTFSPPALNHSCQIINLVNRSKISWSPKTAACSMT